MQSLGFFWFFFGGVFWLRHGEGLSAGLRPVPIPTPPGQMLVEKKEASRQSSILLQSAAPSAQLLRALQEVGSLSRALEEAREQHQQQVRDPQTSPNLSKPLHAPISTPQEGFSPPWISIIVLRNAPRGGLALGALWHGVGVPGEDPKFSAPRVSARR